MKKYVLVDVRVVLFLVISTLVWNYIVFFKFMKKRVRKEDFHKECERLFHHEISHKDKFQAPKVHLNRVKDYDDGSIDKNVRVLLPYIPSGDFLFDIFNAEGFTRGAEVGVSTGGFAKRMLENWKGCEKYYLIDPWTKQDDSSKDKFGNMHQGEANKRVKEIVKDYPCGTVLRNFSHEAAKIIEDGSLDWIFIDSRHDYKSVLEDLVLWFPKVRVGGVVAGRDYLDRTESLNINITLQNERSIMNNGRINKWGKSVKGAVDRFVQEVDVQLLLAAINPSEIWKSWYFRKIRDVKVDISVFEADFEGLEATEENLEKISRNIRYHEWLPTYEELYEHYNLSRHLDYSSLPNSHPLGGKCKKMYNKGMYKYSYKEVCE